MAEEEEEVRWLSGRAPALDAQPHSGGGGREAGSGQAAAPGLGEGLLASIGHGPAGEARL